MTLETKFLFKNNLTDEESINYILERIKNPDKGSEFEQKMSDVISLPKEKIKEMLPIFKEMGYDVLIGYENKKIIGSLAYQKHENTWKIFQYYIKPEKRGNGYAHKLTDIILENAKIEGISIVQPGKGGDDSMKRIIDYQKNKGFKTDLKEHYIFVK